MIITVHVHVFAGLPLEKFVWALLGEQVRREGERERGRGGGREGGRGGREREGGK